MILRSIRVFNWRCFLEPAEVGPLAEGLNVLYAPNATGKSTLFEALRRGLLDGHRVGGKEVEAIRPWSRKLAPIVIIDFTHRGTDYRITKGFLEAAKSVLERKENNRYARIAEGIAADEQVRNILTKNPPGRGLARQEHWGLSQILWAPQGDLAFTSLSGDVLSDIHSSLGTQVSSADAGRVENRIEDLYHQYFTPTGKLKTGKGAPYIVVLRDKLDEAKQKYESALLRLHEFEESARRVEDLRAQRMHAKRDEEAISKVLTDARSQAETYKSLISERTQRSERMKAAEAKYNELKQRIDVIQDTKKEFKEIREILNRLKADAPTQLQEVANRKAEAAEAKAVLEDVRKDRQSVDNAEKIADHAHRFLENKRTFNLLNDRIEKIKQTQDTLAALKEKRVSLVSPDRKILQSIRKVIKERDEAELHIDASLITMEVVPKTDLSIEIITGEEPGIQKLSSGSPIQIKGSPEVVIDLPEVARLRATGPTGTIEQHREEFQRAEQRLRTLTESFGTCDIEELESLAEKAGELEKKIAESETQLDTLLADANLKDIEQDRKKAENALNEVLEENPEWAKSSPNYENLRNEADQKKRSFIDNVEKAEDKWEIAQSTLSAAAEKNAGISARLSSTEKQVKSLEQKLTTFTEDGLQDNERESKLRKIMLEWDAARASFEEIENRLSQFAGDPTKEVEKLEKQLDAAEETATSAHDKEIREEGRLARLSEEGPYSILASIEEEISNLEKEILSEELRVNGIRLIYEMVDQCRREALGAVTGPVELAATRTLQRIAGGKLGRLQFGDYFEPTSVLPETLGSSVSLDNVSGGEREQIYLATRLALADVFAKEERQLVVLDDVLAFTDPGRLARVMTILEEAAQHLQILILTCYPVRYRSLDQAKFFDIEEIVRSSTD